MLSIFLSIEIHLNINRYLILQKHIYTDYKGE